MVRRIRTPKRFKTRLAPTFPVIPFAAVFVTLAAVILAMSPLVERHGKGRPPHATHTAALLAVASRTLSIEADGGLLLDGRRLSAPALGLQLRELAGQSPQPVIRVRGAKGVKYRQVKAVLDQARAEGLQDLRLEVSRSPG